VKDADIITTVNDAPTVAVVAIDVPRNGAPVLHPDLFLQYYRPTTKCSRLMVVFALNPAKDDSSLSIRLKKVKHDGSRN